MPLYRPVNMGASEAFAVFGGKIPRTPFWYSDAKLPEESTPLVTIFYPTRFSAPGDKATP